MTVAWHWAERVTPIFSRYAKEIAGTTEVAVGAIRCQHLETQPQIPVFIFRPDLHCSLQAPLLALKSLQEHEHPST